jgi:hypothetical protein
MQTSTVIAPGAPVPLRRNWKKGPCLDLSGVMPDHPAPFIRRTAEMPWRIHVYDIIELVCGTTDDAARMKWNVIKKTFPEFEKEVQKMTFEGDSAGQLFLYRRVNE